MTQQPFSRPGAIDLSALRQPASVPPAPGAAAGGPATSSYSVQVTPDNFQQVLQESMTAPVVVVFYSPAQAPGSEAYAADVVAAVESQEGRFLAALVDVDAAPEIAQAMQVPQVPLMLIVLEGRPATQPLPGALSADELQVVFGQMAQQLAAQGIAGRHQPRHSAPVEGAEEQVDPRYAPAQDALASGDIDAAIAEYQKLVDANPADAEAAGGLAMAKVLKRTQGVDLNQARTAAADNPDDVEAQTLVADLDMVGGHVEDAFTRLINLVGRSVDPDKSRARDHLLGLFAAVGNDDPRVLAGRRNLASALF